MSKNNNKKKLFGRNIFTLVFAFVILLLVIIVGNNISVSIKNNVKPFEINAKGEAFEEGEYNLEDCKYVKGDEFDAIGLTIECSEYNEDTDKAVYKVMLYENENTENIDIVNSSIKAQVCLASDQIGYLGYSSKVTFNNIAKDKNTASSSTTYKKTFTINSVIDYPAKTEHFPIPLTVKAPDIYLYITYSYKENAGQAKNATYIIEYSYYDLLPLQGGISK